MHLSEKSSPIIGEGAGNNDSRTSASSSFPSSFTLNNAHPAGVSNKRSMAPSRLSLATAMQFSKNAATN
jgi:hypothetical protein